MGLKCKAYGIEPVLLVELDRWSGHCRRPCLQMVLFWGGESCFCWRLKITINEAVILLEFRGLMGNLRFYLVVVERKR